MGGRTDHGRCSIEHAFERRRVAIVQKSLAAVRLLNDALDVVAGMEALQLLALPENRCRHRNLLVQALLHCFLPERLQPIRAERVAFAETVTGQGITEIHRYHEVPLRWGVEAAIVTGRAQ